MQLWRVKGSREEEEEEEEEVSQAMTVTMTSGNAVLSALRAERPAEFTTAWVGEQQG